MVDYREILRLLSLDYSGAHWFFRNYPFLRYTFCEDHSIINVSY